MLFKRSAVRRAAVALAAVAIAGGGALVAPATAGAEPSTRIVGGTPTTTEEYPYVVQVTDAAENQFCGGTLVTPTKVVTAAHCVDWTTEEDILVVAGRTYLAGSDGTVAEASDVWIHPDYDANEITADVAVITLAEELPYATLPVVSSDDTDIYGEGSPTRLLGWGYTSEQGQSSDQLLTAEVPLVSDADCEDAYGSWFIPEAHVCAGLPEGGVDTCQGDSGGPFVIDGVLAGVVSWGNGCARPGNPGVYTRLTTYADDVAAQLGLAAPNAAGTATN
ncbi:S1 family peptidase [Streptomyces sp. 4N509B]|uniref:S1 family peptidase n=1 Tax=Streptomyces sp. 4N509B TaxID=3457413 RepID=UPI003FCF3606